MVVSPDACLLATPLFSFDEVVVAQWYQKGSFRIRGVYDEWQRQEALRFYQRLKRPPWVTYALLGVMILLYLIGWVLPYDDFKVLLLMGAKLNVFIDNGEPWRFISAMFLHGGLMHLGFNGFALYFLGRIAENLYGRRQFFLIFFLSGVVSIYCSYLFSPDSPSVGASGALFGLLGLLVMMGYRHKEDIPAQFRRFFGSALLPWVILNLGLGFVIPQIDNVAHVSGLVSGLLLGWILKPQLGTHPEYGGLADLVLWNASGLAILVTLATFLVMVGNLFGKGDVEMPANWESLELQDVGLRVQMPPSWDTEPLGHQQVGVFIHSAPVVFAVELELPRKGSASDIVDLIEQELVGNPSIDQESILLEPIRQQDWYGTDAWRTVIHYTLKNGVTFRVPALMVNGPKGFASLTCVMQPQLGFAFDPWCERFLQSPMPLLPGE